MDQSGVGIEGYKLAAYGGTEHSTRHAGAVTIIAENAGVSVNQIERFHTRYLPLSAELTKNLQSFGEGLTG